MLRSYPTQRPSPIPARLAAKAEPVAAADDVPHANSNGTWAAVTILALTALLLNGAEPSDLGKFAAYGFALSLAVTLIWDARAGVQNLIRADVLGLISFYFLTFFEFLFPQPRFDEMITPDSARLGILAILLGAAGLMLGRHLWKPRKQPLQNLLTKDLPPWMLIVMFWGCFALGYVHMLMAVNFDVKVMVKYFMDPRFSQPWGRGKFGDWKALLVELAMFIYLIPPLAGVILARRGRYGFLNLLFISAGLGFTLFYGFTSGTRNVFASYLVTLLIAYAFALGHTRRKEIIVLSVICAASMVIATPLMLAFRNVGLTNWLSGNTPPPPMRESGQTVFVDYNLYAICKIIEVFPEKVDYLGLEIPYVALIRPIPRAMWPGKPEGLTYSIEEALGVEGLTISATFVGEAYMAFGMIGVFVTGLIFGALFGWWNHLGSPRNSELGILIYSSGFFCAVITMRSLFAFTVALLPTAAAIGIATVLVWQVMKLEKELMRRLQQQGPARRAPAAPPRRKP